MLAEIDALIGQGAEYLYFIDEIFLPQRALLEALVQRPIQFGIQTRIDLWKPDMPALLGAAGCVSIEAGVESLTEDGRAALDKRCKLTTDELAGLLVLARQHVPFVQANLLEVADDDAGMVTAWRDSLRSQGVWANDPGAALSLSQLTRLPPPVRVAGRGCLGAGAPILPGPVHRLLRHPGRAAAAVAGAGAGVPDGLTPASMRRLLVTTDAVGGVWRYAVDLAGGLARCGIGTVLAVMGPPANTAQRVEAETVRGLRLVQTGLPLDWTADDRADIARASAGLASLAALTGATAVHLHAPGAGRRPALARAGRRRRPLLRRHLVAHGPGR